MIEVTGDLWEYEPADVVCVTTNGHVNKSGLSAMSAGCALEAQTHFPGIAALHGKLLKERGNHVFACGVMANGKWLFTFPVKRHWRDLADLSLIHMSARELVILCDEHFPKFTSIIVPRPGCGYGGRTWEQVRPVIEPILDDRFKIITFPP